MTFMIIAHIIRFIVTFTKCIQETQLHHPQRLLFKVPVPYLLLAKFFLLHTISSWKQADLHQPKS